MDIVFILLLSSVIGLILHGIVSPRDTRGVGLLPSLNCALSVLLWTGLLALGMDYSSFWTWLIALGAPAILSTLFALLLTKSRRRTDQRLFESLCKV